MDIRNAFKAILNDMDTNGPLKTDKETQDALKVIVERVEYFRDENNWPVEEYTDDFKKYHPADHQQWVWLFMQAAFKSRELADTLCILRGMGCELVPDQTYGYVIRPIIGGKGWQSIEQYNLTKEPLKEHTNELLPLLKQLGGESL